MTSVEKPNISYSLILDIGCDSDVNVLEVWGLAGFFTIPVGIGSFPVFNRCHGISTNQHGITTDSGIIRSVNTCEVLESRLHILHTIHSVNNDTLP